MVTIIGDKVNISDDKEDDHYDSQDHEKWVRHYFITHNLNLLNLKKQKHKLISD